jgi:hypothetical protein
MIHKAGYKTQFSQLYSADDPNLETDVQFAVTAALIGHYEAHDSDNEPAPDADVKGRWYSLQHRFVAMPGGSSGADGADYGEGGGGAGCAAGAEETGGGMGTPFSAHTLSTPTPMKTRLSWPMAASEPTIHF